MKFRPNWHPKLQQVLGNIVGAYGYITPFGTVELLGPLWEDPRILKDQVKPEQKAPTIIFSAKGFA